MKGFSAIVKALGARSVALLTSARTTAVVGETIFKLSGLRPTSSIIDVSQVKRILVVRVDEIGDVVMTSPFLRELRRYLPDSWITLVVNPTAHNLVELCPYVNEVLVYDPNTFGRFWRLKRHARALRLGWKRLRHQKFDLAISPRWDIDDRDGAFMLYFSGARWRVGYSESVTPRKREMNGGADRLFTHVLADSALKHEVEHNLDMIRYLGGEIHDDHLELWIGEKDENFAEDVLNGFGRQPGGLVVGFGPSGGNSPLKQWPVDNFIELGCWLQAEYNCRILILGGPGEERLGYEIERALHLPSINVVGKTTLREMAALLRRCHLFIGNDTGPMHVAAAMGTPVIGFFGSSCHHRFRPWGNNHQLLSLSLPCSPCLQAHREDRCGRCIFDIPLCLHNITVEQAKSVVSIRLAKYLVAESGDGLFTADFV